MRHVQIDAVECDDIVERLGDPTSPDCEGRVHGPFHEFPQEPKEGKKRRQGQPVERSQNER
jgi:hypothetical protein